NVDLKVLIHTRGSWNRGAEAARLLGNCGFQSRARGHRFALGTGPGAEALIPRARGEVRIAVARRGKADEAFDADLAMQRVPMHDRRRTRVAFQFPALAGEVVGVEHEVAG